MKPLLAVVVGLVVVLLDLRIDSGGAAPDLLPDPLGWIVAAVGLGRLARLHQGFGLGAVAAGVGVLVSAPLWPGLDSLASAEPWLGLAETVVDLVVVLGVLTAVMAVVPSRSATARSLRTAYVVVTACVALFALGGLVSTALLVLALMSGLVSLVMTVVVLVFLNGVSSETPTPNR